MKKLLSYLRPYRASVAFALVLVFVQSISELLLPALMAEIVDRGVVRGDTGLILRSGVLMLFVALAGAACNILSAFYSSKVSMAFGRDLRLELFSRVESFSACEFDAIGVSTLITRTTNDVSQIQNFLIMALRLLARAPLMAIGGLIMALYTDARLSLVLVVALPLLAASVALVSAKGMPLFRRMQDRIDALNLVLREGLTGIRVVRAFNRLETERVRFRAANEDLRRTSLSAQRIMTVLMPVMMILMNLTTVAVVWFGGLRVDAGAIQVGDLMAFVQYAMQILFSMMMLSAMFAMYPRASISADRVAEVLETSSSIRDPERAPAADPLPERSGRIEFRNVSFRYPGAEEYALREVSFSVAAGETTAIIGGTGSGKTTLVSLLLRFYDAESGSVLVDGRDVREFRQEELCAHGLRPAEGPPFQRDGSRQHPFRRPGCGHGRSALGRGGSPGARFHFGTAARLRDRRGPGRNEFFRGPEATAVDRAGAGASPGDLRLRRQLFGARLHDGRAPQGRPRGKDRRCRRADRSPTHRHHQERRPHRRAGRGEGRRHRHPRFPARVLPGLP